MTQRLNATAYVLTGFPVALAVLILLPLGIGLGVGLMPVLIGFPIFALTIMGWRALARLERRRAALVLGAPIPEVPDTPRPQAFSARWSARLRDGMVWREFAWTWVLGIFALAAACVLFALACAAVALLLLPFVAGAAPADSLLADWPLPWLAPLGGLLVLAVSVEVGHGLGVGLAAIARALLAPSEAALLAQRVASLETTRTGAVEGADATLRRIERDLHDGAQHRLSYVAMELGRARGKLDDDPEAARVLVERAHEESKRAMAELRDLVRGVSPSVLADRGLAAAVPGLASRSPIPVSTKVDVEPRPGRAAETAAYFVVAEALANLGRHSGATVASVDVSREADRLTVVIDDDGRGGAAPAPGGGLAGLAQRVEALDGHFGIVSNAGEGTMVWAELPCGS